jgi:hypothetical protein
MFASLVQPFDNRVSPYSILLAFLRSSLVARPVPGFVVRRLGLTLALAPSLLGAIWYWGGRP